MSVRGSETRNRIGGIKEAFKGLKLVAASERRRYAELYEQDAPSAEH